MMLVSLKNIHIWPSNGQKMARMPMFGHTFFGHNSAFSGPIGLSFYGSSGDQYISIDWWWEIKVAMLIFHFFIFGPLLAGKWAWPPVTTRAPNGLGPPNPIKKLAHWGDLSGQPLSRNHVFEIFTGEPPLLLKSHIILFCIWILPSLPVFLSVSSFP